MNKLDTVNVAATTMALNEWFQSQDDIEPGEAIIVCIMFMMWLVKSNGDDPEMKRLIKEGVIKALDAVGDSNGQPLSNLA